MISESLQSQLALLPDYLGHHLLLTLVALVAGVTVCLPLGIFVTRVRPLQWPVLTAAGVLQTIPGLALLALMVPLLGTIGFVPAVLALILYSFLPILRNSVTGILGVDPAIREAATGMGMTGAQRLWRVELPLALPVIVAGIRTAAVWVVGTATLATPVGATSLGNFIFSGLQTQNVTAVLVGCIAAALLAIVLDGLIRLAEWAAILRSRRLGATAIILLLLVLGGGLWPVAQTRTETASFTLQLGSKPFTEQYVLSELIADVVERAGYRVEQNPSMGSLILFEALTQNNVHVYVDYSGTLWTNVLGRKDTPPRDTLLHELSRGLDSAFGVLCLGPLGFENTYALAMRRSAAESLGVKTVTDLAVHSADMKIGSDYEFFSRPEWESLRSRYQLAFSRQVTLDPSLMYSAIAETQVDVISAYSTDGRIIDFDLVTLADPRQALPPYDAVLLLSPQAARDPALRTALGQVLRKIGAGLMREANRLVDQEGRTPAEAARYLRRRLEAAESP